MRKKLKNAKASLGFIVAFLVIASFGMVSRFYYTSANPGAFNADDLLGQLDSSNNPVYTQSLCDNNSCNGARGFNQMEAVAVDTTNRRLFVADSGNSRVLVYNLDSSNQPIDLVADYVIGQVDFVGTTANSGSASVSATGLSSPQGLAFDAVNNRLYISDTLNNRVLVFNVSTITNGMTASFVLGQSSVTASSSATTQSGMNAPTSLAFDSSGNRLFVADVSNNRVLVFSTASLSNGQNAANVLGQANFTSSASATTQSGLNAPRGLAFDSSGNRLFVAETSNNRVVIHSVSSIVDNQNAANVLGQANFTSAVSATTQSGLSAPYGVAFDSSGNRLFISDRSNNRVVIHSVSSIVDNQNAANVLGQANFTSSGAATTQSGLNAPEGLAYDGTSVWVVDFTNNRVGIFNVASPVNGQNMTSLLGQLNASDAAVYTTSTANNGSVNPVVAKGLKTPRGSALDTTNHRLFIADTMNHRILVFNLDSTDALSDRTADFVLGQANFTSSSSGSTQSTLNTPSGLAFDATNNRLYVADTGNSRVLIFNTSSITNGQNAANVFCQPDFTTVSGGTTQSKCRFTSGVAFDSTNTRLFVSELTSNRVLVFNTSSITNGQNAANVLGQLNFTTGSAGTAQAQMSAPAGVAFDSTNNRLFVADTGNNRVLVFNTATITDAMNAANVLGQANFTSSGAATTQSGMSAPTGAPAYDTTQNRLYVSDMRNQRVLVFEAASLSNGQNAANVIGQTSFTASASGSSQSAFNVPRDIAYDATNRRVYVSDASNSRVMIFNTIRITTATVPNGEVNTAYSQTIATTKSQGTVTFAVSSGSLPAGLSLNTSTGALTGTPTTAGATSFTIQATDTGDAGTFINSIAYTPTIAADTTAPVISGISSSSITNSGATIAWTTGEAGSSVVEYGLTNAYGTSTTETDTSPRVTSHSVTVSGLLSGILYHFRVKSKDTAGNEGVSSDQTLTTVASSGSSLVDPPPSAATNISGAYDGSGQVVILAWTKPGDQDLKHCELWRNEGGATPITGPRAFIASCASPYRDTENIQTNKTYRYQLVSVDNSSNKTASQEVSVSTTVAPAVAVCGNGLCESGETAALCVADCPAASAGAPKLELSLSAEVIPKTPAAIVSVKREATLSVALALSFAFLMLGAFMIHTHAVGMEGNLLNFFAVFPLLFTSSANSYQYLRRCGPDECKGAHFGRYKLLKHFGRISLTATVLAGAIKFFMVFVISSFISASSNLVYAQTESVFPGDRIRVTASVKNAGDAKATNVLLEIPTPAGTSFFGEVAVDATASALAPFNSVLSVPFSDIAPSGAHIVKATYMVTEAAVQSGVVRVGSSVSAAEMSAPLFMDGISFPVVASSPPASPKKETAPEPESKSEPITRPAAIFTPVPVPVPAPIVPPPDRRSSFSGEFGPLVEITVNFKFDTSTLALASLPSDIAGQIPILFNVMGSVPANALRIEAVLQSDPQVFVCPIEGATFECAIAATVDSGSHTLFAQATDLQGNRRRISNVVQFNVTLPACFDNIDNDGDGLIDYQSDPGCKDRADDDETDSTSPIAEIIAPILPQSIAEPVVEATMAFQNTKVYVALDKKVINNPKVEKANVTIAAPVIAVAVAANTAASIATTGVTFASLLAYLQGFVTQPFLLFTRRKRKQWGIVYSSLTKLPVDLAVVRLLDSNTNRLLQTRVTDKQGRYLFFADPGTYRLEVTKTGYAFPSQYLKEKTSDVDFTDLYLGGPLMVSARKTLTHPIPVDPQDNNETPKDVISRGRRRAIQKTVAYSGPVFAMVSLAISPTLTTTTLLALQFVLLGVFRRLAIGAKPKTWATILDADTGVPIPFAVVRIFDATYNKLLETQITEKSGHYAFLVGRGAFYITAEKPGYVPYHSETLDLTKSGSEEVVKKDIRLKKGAGSVMTSSTATASPSITASASPGGVGIPLIQNPSQADLPNNGGNGNGKSGNGKKNGNGYGHA